MNRKDWLLIAIHDSLEPIQIQKTMFKFAKESGIPPDEQYEFVPYNWGPCSFEIYADLAALREEGSLEAVPTYGGWSMYRLTPVGQESLATLRSSASPNALERLDEVRKWVKSRTFEELLKDVYADYPDYATQSMFTG